MTAPTKTAGPTETLLTPSPERQRARGRKDRFARRRILRDAVPVLAPLLPIAILAALLATAIFGAYSGTKHCGINCDPNGNIRVLSCHRSSSSYRRDPFNVDYSLAIGLGWGELSFATAKAIDVLWDALVGRGWQALTAWIVYAVFRRCWAVQYERAKTGVPVQAVMCLQYQTVSVGALRSYVSVLGTCSLASWRAGACTLILILSTLHVFFAPTWLSAMTGYMALSEPMLKLNGANYVAASGLQTCGNIVVDGDRIGLPRNACVAISAPDPAFSRLSIGEGCEVVPKAGCEEYSIDAYDYKYQASNPSGEWPKNINSTFYAIDRVYHLSPPLLTIRLPTQVTMGYDNHIYTTDYLRNNGVCQPRNKYKWGFSFNLTFAWLLSSNVLGLSLYVVWLGTFRGSELADKVFGSEKTVMVIAEAFEDMLGRKAPRMSNEELAWARKGYRIGVDVSKCSGVDVSLLQEERKRSADVFVA